MLKSCYRAGFFSTLLMGVVFSVSARMVLAQSLPTSSAVLDDASAQDLERIEVTSRVPHYQHSLSKVLPQTRVLDETSHSSDSLAELLINAPEISLNGQGGLLQSVNIRGFSRWRIQTLVEGIPIYTERRAGTSAEFVPPTMVSDALITAGAASTQLGSGAIGGGLDIQLAQPDHTQLKLAWGDSQDYRDVQIQGKLVMPSALAAANSAAASKSAAAPNSAATANNTVQYAFNHRHANNSSDGNGMTRLDGFEQHSGLLRLQTGAKDGAMWRESLVFWSGANNINKASADDPARRFTVYPENNHLLGKFSFNWHNLSLYFHDSRLETLVTRPNNRSNLTRNQAFDVGVQGFDQFRWHRGTVNWRVAVDGRTSVTARETERTWAGNTDHDSQDNTATELVFDRVNLDAEQWQASVALDTQQALSGQALSGQALSGQALSEPADLINTLSWVGGVRVARHLMKNTTAQHLSPDPSKHSPSEQSPIKQSPINQSNDRTETSAFLGLAWQANTRWQSNLYLSSAYRVPSLTELYFNGATPRGTVLGDPNLNTEQALNMQFGVQYQQPNHLFEFNVFHQRIDNYIERLRINDELRQYRNLNNAVIQGVNYRWQQQGTLQHIDWHWQLSGQWLNGEDNAGQPVQDISPAEHRALWRLMTDNIQTHVALRYRQSSSDLVNGELPTPSVTSIDLGTSYQFSDALQLTLNVTNLTDKLYVTSRDDLAPFARGRNIQLGMVLSLD